jgi:hypothetical protein
MQADTLVQAISTLTPEQQESVRQFVEFLKSKESTASSFLAAVDEFIEEHPELLRHLAQ